MKASELRIGNFADYHGEIVELKTGKEIDGCTILNPITLTEEWLLKFGFDKRVEFNGHEFKKEYFQLWKGNNWEFYNYSVVGRECDGINEPSINVETVHQLQNLYFALTGEELTIRA